MRRRARTGTSSSARPSAPTGRGRRTRATTSGGLRSARGVVPGHRRRGARGRLVAAAEATY
eukprot:scaffold225550_cov47-Prasinocladus_malaysianus.AAC.1